MVFIKGKKGDLNIIVQTWRNENMPVEDSELLWQYKPNIKAIKVKDQFILEMDKETFLMLTGSLVLSSLQPYNACIHNSIAKQLDLSYCVEKTVE